MRASNRENGVAFELGLSANLRASNLLTPASDAICDCVARLEPVDAILVAATMNDFLSSLSAAGESRPALIRMVDICSSERSIRSSFRLGVIDEVLGCRATKIGVSPR